ncbi:MAG: hypothetical protein JNL58_05675 [Planctomyces sp.]|nr:hypothetical protein [Planctomyces sp.]
MNKVVWRRVVLSLLVVFWAFESTALQAQVRTSQAVSFGDSLTDNEDLDLVFGTPASIYGADPFEAMFNKASFPGDQLTNYAVLGSTSEQVFQQVQAYAEARKSRLVPRSTLVSIQGGANDFLAPENIAVLASAAPGESRKADAIINRIRQNLVRSVQTIQRVDHAQIVVWTVPDVTLSPYGLFYLPGDEGAANIRAHINRLNRFIRGMECRRSIAVLDLSSLLTASIISPPVIYGVPLYGPPAFGFPLAIFADPLHPTAVSNGLTANLLIEEVNENFRDDVPFYSEDELATMAGF